MQNIFDIDEWKIIETSFDPKKQLAAESIFSIGNGAFGQRANFEESYTGESLQGSYVGGVYYPDKTRVGWWKNGYPEYFAKVLNSCNWIGIDIEVDSEKLDLATIQVKHFYRELDMRNGTLTRKFTCELKNGKIIQIKSTRFCSMNDDEIGAISYSIKPINFSGNVTFIPYLDFNVRNSDSNYNEFFWKEINKKSSTSESFISAVTKKSDFNVVVAFNYTISKDREPLNVNSTKLENKLYVANKFEVLIEQGSEYILEKYVTIISSLNHEKDLESIAVNKAIQSKKNTFHKLLNNHIKSWHSIWENADVKIEGDLKSQQAIRFNIFQLYQTYTGNNAKLNIGPKGFTGEKYGGATYWDTEAFCLPFFLKTSPKKVAKQLLIYRYNHLKKAILNAEKLGFHSGAALYPMVTMNGDECHNEWEITFEEIHRNGAIAYAIFNYIRHTNDKDYLLKYGRKVLIAIARFWVQRVNWSNKKNKYVILGVTGPNEYENNVNNNWYTNYIARWCILYALKTDNELGKNHGSLISKEEESKWKDISENMYLPKINNSNIFLQNDGFLDKEFVKAEQLSNNDRPINQNWSWDKILRSVFIKQADVLQGLYFFEEHFDIQTIKENIEFYEPYTVHESSLSACIHSILYSLVKEEEQAYKMFLQTVRLDLDDYNKEVDEGLHITSMPGSWLSIVEGFAGLRIRNNKLFLNPTLPNKWKSYSFNIIFNDQIVNFDIRNDKILIYNKGRNSIDLSINGRDIQILENNKFKIEC